MLIERFTIDARYCGPPNSGNGGYTCGRIARHLAAGLGTTAVRVRLQAPPPLQAELRLESAGDEAQLYHGDVTIARATVVTLELPIPPCPDLNAAKLASTKYIGFRHHTFPGCFVCGPDRPKHDGLAIFAGPLGERDGPGNGTIASPWNPDSSLADAAGQVRPEFLWAALDCPGAFTWYPLPEGTAIVLGELTAAISGSLRADEAAVVIGWPIAAEGRKRLAGTAVFGADGRLIAKARAVWLEVPLDSWR